MQQNNLETIILVLLFFLPGYFYFSLKTKFKYQSLDNKEIMLLGFLFNSIIFQFLAWLILRIFKLDILDIFKNNNSLNNLFMNNLWPISLQVITTLALAFITAIIFSTNQFRRFVLWFQRKTSLSKILRFSLEYVPSVIGALEHDIDFGKKAIDCVIQLKNSDFYEGSIRHIGYGSSHEDYLIVLSKVTKLSKGIKTKLPDDVKMLIPYDNIESIAYKEYPIAKDNTNSEYSAVLSPLNISFILVLILLLLLFALQQQSDNTDLLRLITELYGAFMVTFLGVYISISHSNKQEKKKNEEDKTKVYLGALKLLVSELSLNEQPLKTLSHAIYNIPPDPSKYYDNYGFILEMTKDVQTKVFYSVIASGSMEEVSKSEKIFNKVQQAYFNTSKAINGISISREVFKDYEVNSKLPSFPQWKEMVNGMIKQEGDKVKRAQEMVTSAKEEIIKELSRYKVTFVE